MQQDEDVGKISQATPMLIANAMEQFVGNLCSGTAAIAAGRGSKTISASHLKACIQGSELLDFLTDVVQDVPDLPPEDQPKVKKQRSSYDGEADAAGGTSRGRGRGRPPGSGRGRAGCPPGSGRGRGSRGGRTSRPKAVEDDVDLEDGDGLQAGDQQQQGQGPPATELDDTTSHQPPSAAEGGAQGSEPDGGAAAAAVPLQQGASSGFAFQAGPAAAEDEDDYDEEDEDED